jgi:hypothetical protein
MNCKQRREADPSEPVAMRSSRIIVIALLLSIVSKLDAYSATSLLPLVSPFRWGAAALHHLEPSKGRPGVLLTPARGVIFRGALPSLRCGGGGGSGSSALLSSGGELASRSESMSVFKVKRKLREEKALEEGSEWITSIQDDDILRSAISIDIDMKSKSPSPKNP